MYQEIIFCNSIFEKIIKCFQEEKLFDSDTYYQNLQLKKIKTIPSNWNVIEKGICQHRGFKDLFKNHIFTDKLNFSIPPKPQKLANDQKLNLLLNLANESESKILHTEVKDVRNSDNEKLLQELEIADISQFNNPSVESRLVAVSRNIKIFRGDFFHFEKILKFYFHQTKILIVSDKFIRKRKEGFNNLKRFIRMCPNLQELTIFTDKKEEYSLTVEKMSAEIKAEFHINPIIESASEHQRTITTNKFTITIDPGLDFVNEEYKAEKHHVDIQIKMLNA